MTDASDLEPPSHGALDAVHALWDRLAAYPLMEIDEACRFLMGCLGEWLQADNAAWIGTIRLLSGPLARRDPLFGWRAKTLNFLHPPEPHEQLLAKRFFAKRRPPPDMTAMAIARLAGTFRVHHLHDGFIDLAAYQRTRHYQTFYKALGVRDRLWVATPIGPDAESIFVFDKRSLDDGDPGRMRFAAAQVSRASHAIMGLTWFQRNLMYSYGLPLVESPLTAMERRIVRLLLSDKPEKAIAAELRQSQHTTHDHIKEIYRKYGVSGRAALMAIWLSRR